MPLQNTCTLSDYGTPYGYGLSCHNFYIRRPLSSAVYLRTGAVSFLDLTFLLLDAASDQGMIVSAFIDNAVTRMEDCITPTMSKLTMSFSGKCNLCISAILLIAY